ncbi:MAG: hypothetical protein ABI325_07670 [Ginsengibacter sp.]
MNLKPCFLIAFSLCTSFHIVAQNISGTDALIAVNSTENVSSNSTSVPEKVYERPPLNLVKLNLTGILLNNYALQYERILNHKISVAFQYRMMPKTGIPFKSIILKQVGNDDPETKKLIDDFRMSNFAITPELRIYLGKKGYGRGFYIAPFYRYASFKSSDLNVFYTDVNNVDQSIKMSGKLTSNTAGLLMGVQSDLGKHVNLDISFFGPHYGSGKGTFSGTTSSPLSSDEQYNLRRQLENLDIPLIETTVNVNANGASLKLDGPWAGYRFAISLGLRF